MFGICALACQNLFIKEELTDTETLFRLLRIKHKGEGHLANDKFGRQNKEDKQNLKRSKFRNLILYISPPQLSNNISCQHKRTTSQYTPHHSSKTITKVNAFAMCLSGKTVFMLLLLKILKKKCDIMSLCVYVYRQLSKMTMTTMAKDCHEKMMIDGNNFFIILAQYTFFYLFVVQRIIVFALCILFRTAHMMKKKEETGRIHPVSERRQISLFFFVFFFKYIHLSYIL
ncbi:hypothetical protein RFI_31764 [Reticulomyxa filosa]|uniref:Uncharacterized protein n=1 Tax=Reticulomyxa filosa TaxID=46433 RepID=X6LWV6_RETFI|nr:hypothetical protein RFI_31764 [Reticulomyxa filosa]|eukprot:ETO05632.1 hypothetical protein RFI_31764 [Reticulomyxa filosa]